LVRTVPVGTRTNTSKIAVDTVRYRNVPVPRFILVLVGTRVGTVPVPYLYLRIAYNNVGTFGTVSQRLTL